MIWIRQRMPSNAWSSSRNDGAVGGIGAAGACPAPMPDRPSTSPAMQASPPASGIAGMASWRRVIVDVEAVRPGWLGGRWDAVPAALWACPGWGCSTDACCPTRCSTTMRHRSATGGMASGACELPSAAHRCQRQEARRGPRMASRSATLLRATTPIAARFPRPAVNEN